MLCPNSASCDLLVRFGPRRAVEARRAAALPEGWKTGAHSHLETMGASYSIRDIPESHIGERRLTADQRLAQRRQRQLHLLG
jgi:hypothetical protein